MNVTTVAPLIRLSDAGGGAGEVGAKAANLAVVIEAGFAVPDGFVLPAAALQRAFADNINGELLGWVQAALDQLGPGPVAVRSSGIAEDAVDASYAGQYETELGLDGVEEVAAAIQRCWRSAESERVASYSGRDDGEPPPPMAVIIQRLVPADAAGVAFTANPVTGARHETLVSVVRGLGDALVSGAVSPDEWVVKGELAQLQATGAEQAATRETVLAVAGIARRLEKLFGRPQDMEWATAGGEIFVLQSRPITALPDPATTETEEEDPAADAPPGFWERDASHFPHPLTPMMRSLVTDRQNAALREAFAEHGILADGLEFREIGGWVYSRIVPPGGVDRPPLPAPLMWLMVRMHPDLRRRVAVARRTQRDDLAGEIIRRWHAETRPDLERRIAELRSVELDDLDDSALLDHWRAVDDLLGTGVRAHFRLHVPIAMARHDLVKACRELLGWDDRRSFELLNGLSSTSTKPSFELAELARLAEGRPDVMGAIERADRESVSRLAEDREFAVAFERYQRDYSIRARRLEVAEPILAETPELTLATLRDQIRHGYDPHDQAQLLSARRSAMASEARRQLAAMDDAARSRFDRALERAEAAHPVHEENEFFTLSVPLGLARLALLEIGRRLASRGIIDHTNDVFFLTDEEALAALAGDPPADADELRDSILRRKADRARALTRPGPATYGRRPPPPPLAALPPATRRALEVLLWAVDLIFAAARSGQRQSAKAGTIAGIAASPGHYEGTVRRVMDEDEFDKIQAGDVLVCPVTSPVWSILFSRIGALVTDTGGILSHPAIIAREFGIPAVVATGNATQLLRDGQLVTVDGDAGSVTRHLPVMSDSAGRFGHDTGGSRVLIQ
jgi:pyruvate,water dikinase